MSSRIPKRAQWAAALMMVAGLAQQGCAASRTQQAATEMVWPKPPSKPRIRFVRVFQNQSDLAPSLWDEVMRALAGGGAGSVLQNPTTVALSRDQQRLYVACPPISRVVEFNLHEGVVRAVRFSQGNEPYYPFGVALDSQDNLYISDSTRRAVMVYARDGKFLRQIGQGLLHRPVGLAVDPERQRLYVAEGSNRDSERHMVEVFSTAGEHLFTIGRKGNREGEFFFPVHVAVAPDGRVYVADSLNFRIQVFDPQGNFLAAFGQQGDTVGSFGSIKGMGFDSLGLLHVVDGMFGAVQVFNSNHRILMAYGGSGPLPGLLNLPTGITIDAHNNIYVVSYLNGNITQYELFNTTNEEVRASLK